MAFTSSRRSFLAHCGLLVGAAALGRAPRGLEALAPPATGASPSAAPPAAPPAGLSPDPLVLEGWLSGLRDEDGAILTPVLNDVVLGCLQNYSGTFPLDGLAELFPDEPPVAVAVDARAGHPRTTRVLAGRLAASLVDMGSRPESVVVLDAHDGDLTAGGYTIVRGGAGPLCLGSEPEPGYGTPVEVPGTGRRARFSKVLDTTGLRLAVVCRLHSVAKRMGPFALDAALRVVDEETRKSALADPKLGARLLASPLVSGRLGLVVADLLEVPVGDAAEIWRADEILLSRGLFAVERVGHTILTNARQARGLSPVAESPILAAAAKLDIPGARLSSLKWRKSAA